MPYNSYNPEAEKEADRKIREMTSSDYNKDAWKTKNRELLQKAYSEPTFATPFERRLSDEDKAQIEVNLEIVKKAASKYEVLSPAQVVESAKHWVEEARKCKSAPGKVDFENMKRHMALVDMAVNRIGEGVNEQKHNKLVSCLTFITNIDYPFEEEDMELACTVLIGCL